MRLLKSATLLTLVIYARANSAEVSRLEKPGEEDPFIAPLTEAATTVECTGPFEVVTTDTETTSTFHDSVLVTGTDIKMTCDLLTVVTSRSREGAAKGQSAKNFKSLLATGNVHLVRGVREAACGRAEIRPGASTILLTDHPVAVDREIPATWVADELLLSSLTREITGKNVHVVFGPLKNLPFKPDKGSLPGATLKP